MDINRKSIYKLNVVEIDFPKKYDWLGEWDQEYDEDFTKINRSELYFGNWEEMNEYIGRVTDGFHQYCGEPFSDFYNNNGEELEYHNGEVVWDKELHIRISQIHLTESFWKAIDQYRVINGN